MAYRDLRGVFVTVQGISNGDQHPDQAGGDNHGLGLAQMQEFFADYNAVGNHKQHQRRDAEEIAGQVDSCGFPRCTGQDKPG